MPHIYTLTEPVEARRRHHHARHHVASPDRQRHHQERRRRIEPPDFRFCVELGLVIRSRRRDHETVSDLAAELSARFSREGIANHIASAVDRTSRRLPAHEWTIASELCIPSRPRDHRFGIKLVSPFMRFSRRPEAWQAELRAVMGALNTHFELTTTHQCFTHVHLAPAGSGGGGSSNGRWELGQAQALAKSALYFERCLDALVPPYRRRSVWAKSNRHNRYFAGLPMAECFARVGAQASLAGLALRMNWCAAASPTGRALGALPGADFQHDAYRWSFAGLHDGGGGGLGTVEFRQPPGVTSAAEAITWVMLVGCLARLSCGLADSLEPANKAQLKSLGEWLLYEAEWCGMPHKGLLTDLVKQAVPVTVAPGVVAGMDADVITIDDDQRLRWKAKDRNVAAEKYKELMGDF